MELHHDCPITGRWSFVMIFQATKVRTSGQWDFVSKLSARVAQCMYEIQWLYKLVVNIIMPPFCVMTETDRFERIAGKLNFEIFNPLFEKLSIFFKVPLPCETTHPRRKLGHKIAGLPLPKTIRVDNILKQRALLKDVIVILKFAKFQWTSHTQFVS